MNPAIKTHLTHLAAALRFITILPAGAADAYHPRAMIPFFPAVGLILGLILAAADALFFRLFSPSAAGAADVIVLVVLTGALHLDGLADAADGFFSHRDRETTLSIMKDSRIGVMGAVVLICVLLAKYGGISGMPDNGTAGFERFLILMLVPAYARSAMLLGVRFLPYARPGGGTATDLFGRPLSPADFWGIGVCVVLSLLLGWQGLLLTIVFFALCAWLIRFYRRRIGGITGDMLGAMCEITEALLLLCAAIRL